MTKLCSHNAVIPLVISAMLTSGAVAWAKDCRVIEYADHYEAVCVGDPNYSAKPSEQKDSKVDDSKGAQASKKRGRIEEIRSLNAHRFDPVESKEASETIKTEK
jgi:hypothetical protein